MVRSLAGTPRAIVFVVLAAAALCVVLVTWISWEPTPASSTLEEYSSAPSETPVALALTSKGQIDQRAGRMPSPVGHSLLVDVRIAGGGAVENAIVRVVRTTGPPETAPAVVAEQDILAQATSGPSGSCALNVPRSTGATRWILVRHAAYKDASKRYAADQAHMTMELDTGLAVAGMVQADGDAGPGDLVVRAVHLGSLELGDGCLAPKFVNTGSRVTRTDDRGRFRFEGLASGAYRLTVEGRGWIQVNPPGERRRGSTASNVRMAGARDVELHVRAARIFVVRFLDADSERPVLSYPDELVVRLIGPDALEPMRAGGQGNASHQLRLLGPISSDGVSIQTGIQSTDPSLFVGLAVPKTGEVLSDHATVIVDHPLYRRGRAQVRLHTPDALASKVPPPDVIRLSKPAGVPDVPTGTIEVLEASREAFPYWQSPWRNLWLRAVERNHVLVLRGRWNAVSGRWFFTGAPEGEYIVCLADESGTSEEKRVRVVPNGVVQAEIAFVGRSGLVLDLRDVQGRVIHSLDLVSVSPVDPSVGIAGVDSMATGWGWDSSRELLLRKRVDVPPGRYRLEVFKTGYGWANADAVVAPNEPRVVTLRFSRDDPVLDKDGPPGPAPK